MKFVRIALFSVLLIFAATVSSYADSFNVRYGFAVEVSYDRYDEIDISINGSGMDFKLKEDPQVVASFYGSWHVLDSFAQEAMMSVKEGVVIIDVKYQPDYFSILYEFDGLKRKTVKYMYQERIIYGAYFKAPSDKFADFLPEFEEIEASWKIGIPTRYNGLEGAVREE